MATFTAINDEAATMAMFTAVNDDTAANLLLSLSWPQNDPGTSRELPVIVDSGSEVSDTDSGYDDGIEKSVSPERTVSMVSGREGGRVEARAGSTLAALARLTSSNEEERTNEDEEESFEDREEDRNAARLLMRLTIDWRPGDIEVDPRQRPMARDVREGSETEDEGLEECEYENDRPRFFIGRTRVLWNQNPNGSAETRAKVKRYLEYKSHALRTAWARYRAGRGMDPREDLMLRTVLERKRKVLLEESAQEHDATIAVPPPPHQRSRISPPNADDYPLPLGPTSGNGVRRRGPPAIRPTPTTQLRPSILTETRRQSTRPSKRKVHFE